MRRDGGARKQGHLSGQPDCHDEVQLSARVHVHGNSGRSGESNRISHKQ